MNQPTRSPKDDCRTDLSPNSRTKKVTIRLISGGQPITGTIERYNPYELRLQTAKGKLVLFKHAIATIEVVDEPKSYRPGPS